MKDSKNVIRLLAMVTQFGLNMLVPIFMCSFIGMWLDKKLGTSFLVILLFFVGAMAGARNVWVFARRFFMGTETGTRRRRGNRTEASDDRET